MDKYFASLEIHISLHRIDHVAMPKTRKRLVFAGTGGMGQAAHLSSYTLLSDDCEVVACADLDAKKAKLVATRHGIAHSYSSFDEMLSTENYDGIVASQQFQQHHLLVPKLLSYNKPVFIEKPLASSLSAAKQLMASIEGKEDNIFIGYHKRSDLATVHAKQVIEAYRAKKDKDRMTHLRVVMPPGDWMRGGWPHRRNIPPQTTPPPMAFDDADPHSSEAEKKQFTWFVNFFIHQINLIRFLLGEDFSVKYASPNQCLLVGESISGVSICLEMNTYHSCVGWHESAEIYFENSHLRLQLPAPLAQGESGVVEFFENLRDIGQEQETRVTFRSEHAMLSQAKNFLKFLDGEYNNNTSVSEAIKDLEVAQSYLEILNRNGATPCP